QQGDVRTTLAGQANGLLPVGRLTGDLKPFLLQEQSDALPDDLVVVSQQNARRHLDTSLTGSGEGGNPESPSNRTRKIPNGLSEYRGAPRLRRGAPRVGGLGGWGGGGLGGHVGAPYFLGRPLRAESGHGG